MRVHIVDPSAYTPPYDHALCAALAAHGADVSLYTSAFAYGSVAPAEGYERSESFYRLAARVADARLRRLVKLLEHVPDMLTYRRAAHDADLVHFQWLTVQHLDGRLLPRGRPLVLTAHDVLPREARPGQRAAQRRLYRRFDAVIVHSRHGARRLTEELGVDPQRVHVVPHGALQHLAQGARPGRSAVGGADASAPEPSVTDALPLELRSVSPDRKVVLCFGLMRPYKGLDLLLDAWREGVDGAELWLVGMPRMDISGLKARAPESVGLLARYVDERELAACFQRADLVVLPYREIDQSGVLFTALAFGKPMLLSDVGGFPEIAASGAARCFPAGDARALREALLGLLATPEELARMGAAASAAAGAEYSWDAIATRTLALYEALLEERRVRAGEVVG